MNFYEGMRFKAAAAPATVRADEGYCRVSNSTINLYMHHNGLKMPFCNMYKLSFDIETL